MRTRSALLSAVLLLSTSGTARSGVYETQEQALSEIFPGGYERKTRFLTENEARVTESQSRSNLESKIITYYVGESADGEPAGTAFLDAHTVRTSREVVFVWIDADGRVAGSEILAFYEPEDYKVRQGWLDRMNGKSFEDELTLGRDLDGVTGATLTVRALAAAVRRSLVLRRLFSDNVE